MSQNAKATIGALVIMAVCIGVAFALYREGGFLGGALSNQAGVATSSTIQIGPDLDATLFSYNRTCGNRVISTVASPIMLSFHSSVNPNGVIGHLQAASTTKEYDSDLYGCGAVTAYGFSSTTVTKSEFSQ